MILLALAMQLVPPAPVPAEDDIVVMARKLRGWRGTIATSPFGTECVTQVSTGDRDIDQVGCTAMERCWPETRVRIKAARSKKVPEADRAGLEAAARADFIACVNPERRALIEALRDRRAAGANK